MTSGVWKAPGDRITILDPFSRIPKLLLGELAFSTKFYFYEESLVSETEELGAELSAKSPTQLRERFGELFTDYLRAWVEASSQRENSSGLTTNPGNRDTIRRMLDDYLELNRTLTLTAITVQEHFLVLLSDVYTADAKSSKLRSDQEKRLFASAASARDKVFLSPSPERAQEYLTASRAVSESSLYRQLTKRRYGEAKATEILTKLEELEMKLHARILLEEFA